MKYTKYTFFWDGTFSQWAQYPMTIDGMTFNCCEQYMMYKKAMTFGDTDSAALIMKTKSPREQKALGRKVKNFVPEIWNAISRDIVFRGNMAKFTQNVIAYDALMETEDTLVVEASPYDKVWGIGLDAEDATCTPEAEWKGTNWLGQIVTECREAFEYSLEEFVAQLDRNDFDLGADLAELE